MNSALYIAPVSVSVHFVSVNKEITHFFFSFLISKLKVKHLGIQESIYTETVRQELEYLPGRVLT